MIPAATTLEMLDDALDGTSRKWLATVAGTRNARYR